MTDLSERASFNLSIAELAFALGVQHSGQLALNIVQGQFAVANDEDAERILAASGEGLLARDLLTVSVADDEYELAPVLTDAIEGMYEARRTLMCNRIVGGVAAHVAFHVSERRLVRHALRDGVVHELEPLPDVASAVEAALAFFSTGANDAKAVTPASLPRESVDEELFSGDSLSVESRLAQGQMSEETRAQLLGDLVEHAFRGSVVKVDHRPDGTSRIEHSFLLFGGSERVWLVQAENPDAASQVSFSPRGSSELGAAFTVLLERGSADWE